MPRSDVTLQEIRSLIGKILAEKAPEGSFEAGQTFFQEGLGGVTLDRELALTYNRILESLSPDEGTPSARSRASTDSLLQECILKALDIVEKQKGKELDARIVCAFGEMMSKLQSKPVQWQVWCAVDRLTVPDDGFQFGRILFCKANYIETAKAQAMTADIIASCPDPAHAGKQSNIWTDDFVKGTLCKILVTAHDSEAARELADVEFETTFAVLNFFGSVVIHTRFLPIVCAQGDAPPHNVTRLVLEENHQSFRTCNSVHRYNIPFDLTVFDKNPPIKAALLRASALLEGQGETAYRERIVTAMKWAGKGAVAQSAENSFLFYAIALEGLILGRKHHEQLAYKLRLRVAHLLGLTSKGRTTVRDRVRDMYNLRSKIAHTGRTEIPKSDLSFLQDITRSAILHLLIDDKLNKIVTDETLERWFEDRLITGDESHLLSSAKNDRDPSTSSG
jgi:hypothetical protein